MTVTEIALWQALRQNALGVRFRRQHSLGSFIVDFVCLEREVVIEVDGGQHANDPRDVIRDAWLNEHGFRVLRFWNHEVLTNLEGVIEVIRLELGRDAG